MAAFFASLLPTRKPVPPPAPSIEASTSSSPSPVSPTGAATAPAAAASTQRTDQTDDDNAAKPATGPTKTVRVDDGGREGDGAPVLPPEESGSSHSSRSGSRRTSVQHPPAIMTTELNTDTPVSPSDGSASSSTASPVAPLPLAVPSSLSPSSRRLTSGTGAVSPSSGRGSATPPPESYTPSPTSAKRTRSHSVVAHLPSQLEMRERWLARKQIKYQNQGVFAKRNCCF